MTPSWLQALKVFPCDVFFFDGPLRSHFSCRCVVMLCCSGRCGKELSLILGRNPPPLCAAILSFGTPSCWDPLLTGSLPAIAPPLPTHWASSPMTGNTLDQDLLSAALLRSETIRLRHLPFRHLRPGVGNDYATFIIGFSQQMVRRPLCWESPRKFSSLSRQFEPSSFGIMDALDLWDEAVFTKNMRFQDQQYSYFFRPVGLPPRASSLAAECRGPTNPSLPGINAPFNVKGSFSAMSV